MRVQLLVVAAVFFSVNGAQGATLTVSCSDVQSIVSEEGVGRYLLDFGSLSEVEGQLITSAHLEFDLPSGTAEQDWEFEVFTLQTSWRGGSASWTQPWTRAGGDTDDTHARRVQISAGDPGGTVRIDVTGAVQAIVAGEEASNGLLVSPPTHERDGFTLSERTELSGLPAARLVIKTANPRAAGPLGAELVARQGPGGQ